MNSDQVKRAIAERNKMMIVKLLDQVERGFVENDWVEEFLRSIETRVWADGVLSPKQQEKLDELFERY